MIFAIISMIYAGTILFFVGTTALILLAWARRRYADRSPNDLIYVAVSIILLASAGIGIFVASQIVVALGLSA
jgi:pilus assembly protein TadC